MSMNFKVDGAEHARLYDSIHNFTIKFYQCSFGFFFQIEIVNKKVQHKRYTSEIKL
jgi:hypothetical protein